MLTKKKPVVKGHLLYDSIYKKYKCIESENEVVVAQDWWSRSLEENEEQLLMSTGFFFLWVMKCSEVDCVMVTKLNILKTITFYAINGWTV